MHGVLLEDGWTRESGHMPDLQIQNQPWARAEEARSAGGATMSRRLDRLYDEALEKAQELQRQLGRKMRAALESIPAYRRSVEATEALCKSDPVLVELVNQVAVAWEVVELRRQQLIRVKGAA